MGKINVFSTLSNDQLYTTYKTGENGVSHPVSQVFIAGKANITNKHFITPLGMVTEITEEQLQELRSNDLFKLHEKNGFLKVSERKADVEAAVSDMAGPDASAPLTEADFKDDEEVKVVSNARSSKKK